MSRPQPLLTEGQVSPEVRAVLDRVAAMDASPAQKRKTLLTFGIRAEYMPHEGARERARAEKRKA